MPRVAGRGDSTQRATPPARSRKVRSRFLLLLRSAPWTRAVYLLRGSPGVVLALVVATAIRRVAAASGPLFLSSVGSAPLGRQIASGCSERALPTVSNPAVNDEPVMDFYPPQTGAQVEQGDRLVRATMTGLGLPAPYRVLLHSARLRPGTDSVNETVTLFSRPDTLRHVDVLSSVGGPGVWITDRYAGVRGLVAGDTLQLASGSAQIAGIYRDLAGNRFGSVLPGYWCSWADYIVPTLERRPPPFVLVDSATLFGLVPVLAQRAADDPEIQAWWYSPTDAARASLGEARQVDDAISGLAQRVRDTAASLRLSGGGYQRADSLTTYVAAAQRARDSVVGPVLPISLTATLMALLLLAGAGGLWVEQRSREVALLRSRGVAVGPIGVKALLEMLLPVLVGAALGWGLAAALVRLLGPSALLEPGAVVTAARTVGLAAAAGLVALGSIAAIGSVRRVDGRPRRRWRVSMVPWELTLLAAAVCGCTGGPSSRAASPPMGNQSP